MGTEVRRFSGIPADKTIKWRVVHPLPRTSGLAKHRIGYILKPADPEKLCVEPNKLVLINSFSPEEPIVTR
jgi:hypothetical protein